MKLKSLFEAEHPFRYAYPLTDNRTQSKLDQIYQWTEQQFGGTAPMPEVWLTSSDHLKDYANKGKVPDARTISYGLYNYAYPDKIFLNNSLNFNNKKHCAVVAHEFVHYLQYNSGKYDTISSDMLQQLEDEADEIMGKY